MFTGPPKALDEDETEFLDALETVSMANCGGDMGTTNLSRGSLASGGLCLASLDRMLSRLGAWGSVGYSWSVWVSYVCTKGNIYLLEILRARVSSCSLIRPGFYIATCMLTHVIYFLFPTSPRLDMACSIESNRSRKLQTMKHGNWQIFMCVQQTKDDGDHASDYWHCLFGS